MTATDPLQPQSTWTVTGQNETNDFDQLGHVTQGVTVYFKTGLGQTGSVFIAKDAYSVDNVRTAIRGKVAAMDAVSQLTHES